MPSLKELKDLVKSYAKDAPKLSSGKEALLLFAEKKGLLRSTAPIDVPAPPAPADAPVLKKKKAEPLPETLKAPKTPKAKASKVTPLSSSVDDVKPAKKVTVADAKPVVASGPEKKSSPFAQFMASNKGSGLSMAQLAEAYRGQRS